MRLPFSALLIVCGSAAWASGCVHVAGDCDNHELSSVSSPLSGYRAIVFERGCGATVGPSTQVSIVTAPSSLPDGPGNVMVLDTNHGQAPAENWGGPYVSVTWVSEDHLLIRYDSLARSFRRDTLVEGIAVSYEYMPR